MLELVCAVTAAALLGMLLDLATVSIARRELISAGASVDPGRESTPVDRHQSGWPAGRLVVPAVSAALAGASAARLDQAAALVTVVPLVCLVTELAVIDINTRRLPNLLTVPAIPLGAALVSVAALLGAPPDQETLTAVVVAVVVALTVACWWPAALGMGDAKLICAMAVLAAPVGVSVVWGAAVGGLVLSGLFSATLIVTGRRDKGRTVPVGPFLAAGAVLAVLFAR